MKTGSSWCLSLMERVDHEVSTQGWSFFLRWWKRLNADSGGVPELWISPSHWNVHCEWISCYVFIKVFHKTVFTKKGRKTGPTEDKTQTQPALGPRGKEAYCLDKGNEWTQGIPHAGRRHSTLTRVWSWPAMSLVNISDNKAPSGSRMDLPTLAQCLWD
jgi:hypothetical protein